MIYSAIFSLAKGCYCCSCGLTTTWKVFINETDRINRTVYKICAS